MKLKIVTPCTRYENLEQIKKSIEASLEKAKGKVEIDLKDLEWIVAFDTNNLLSIPTEVINKLQSNEWIHGVFVNDPTNVVGKAQLNFIVDRSEPTDWIYALDDDNILHEDFFLEIYKALANDRTKEVIVFNQFVGGKDFTGLQVREAKPENTRYQGIDQAQFMHTVSVLGEERYPMHYAGDGLMIEKIFAQKPEKFMFIDKILCYYNYIEKPTVYVSLPKILVYGREVDELKSIKHLNYESDALNIISRLDDSTLLDDIYKLNPDGIITFDTSPEKFPNLYKLPFDFRRRWINVDGNTSNLDAGEAIYNSSMQYVLNRNFDELYLNTDPLVSLFTPTFNTGEKLYRTYNSIRNQTYTNWEWVIVDDSTDKGKTLKIAEEIASKDPRVQVYSFHKKSGGIVGESKYRAATLCKGKYLVEMDHDDELTYYAMELMVESFRQFPDAGFSYSDCTEINESGECLKYEQGFALHYGNYYKDTYNGYEMDVCDQQKINPKTMRHIVGVPNHFRAWERDTYFRIGGHNRRLSIADDYELIIRTFLGTKMVHVPKLCYIQYMHANESVNNTQNVSRADIQRRVRSISGFYNEQIKNRFEELGYKDWAYEANPNSPLSVQSLYNEKEAAVNYIMKLPEQYARPKEMKYLYQYEGEIK